MSNTPISTILADGFSWIWLTLQFPRFGEEGLAHVFPFVERFLVDVAHTPISTILGRGFWLELPNNQMFAIWWWDFSWSCPTLQSSRVGEEVLAGGDQHFNFNDSRQRVLNGVGRLKLQFSRFWAADLGWRWPALQFSQFGEDVLAGGGQNSNFRDLVKRFLLEIAHTPIFAILEEGFCWRWPTL